MNRMLIVLALWAVCLPFALADPAAIFDPLRAELEAVINQPIYKHAHWGILVADLKTGKPIYELNADKLFAPASVTKLFSTAAALDALGADYRFRTPVYRRGDVQANGELDGDLILVASGDLTMGGRTDREGRITFKDSDHTYASFSPTAELTEFDPCAGLDDLARQVAAAGIRNVRGDVLIDDRLFDKAQGTGSGPSRLTPIIVNDNVIDFIVTPGPFAGKPASVDWRPKSAAYAIDAHVDTVKANQPIKVELTSPSSGRLILRGQIPQARKPLVLIQEVEDPASFARALFIEALRRAGVTVSVSPLATNRPVALPQADAYANLPKTAEHISPPFSECMRLILKVSHNLHAGTLPLLIAVRQGKRTLADGMRLQRDFLIRAGLEAETISFGSAAGGSRADYTTPRATVQLLSHMASRADFAHYETALPVLGVDGTLSKTVDASSPARGKVRAKTGTFVEKNLLNDRYLLLSKALAGYIETEKGQTLAFAMFVNNTHLRQTSETAREGKTLGKLCEIIHRGF